MSEPLTPADKPTHGGHLEPLPPTQPVAEELLNAMALLHLERAALRDELGYENQGRRRTFTKEDLARGASLGPLAFIDEGELVFKLES